MSVVKYRGKVDGVWWYVSPDHNPGLFGSFWYIVDRDTVGQYTGLQDKHGKDIFGGDILSRPGSSPWLVEWGKIGLGDHEIDCHGWLVPQGLESYEIIGNLYENGDLLK